MKTGDAHFFDEDSARDFMIAQSVNNLPKDLDWEPTGYNEIPWGEGESISHDVEFMIPVEEAEKLTGTLVWFHDSEIAKIEKRNVAKAKRAVSNYTIRSLIATTFFSVIYGWTVIPNIHSAFGLADAAWYALLLLITVAVPVFFLNAFVSWGEDALVERKWKQEIETPADQELFFFGKGSIALEMMKRSDDFLKMVKEKVFTYPTGDELYQWCKNVDAVLELQPTFPKNLIPEMSADVEVLRNQIVSKLNELQGLENERKAVYSTMMEDDRELIRSDAADSSTAKLEGALTFIEMIDAETLEELREKK